MNEKKVCVTLSDPVAVAVGPETMEGVWGPFQFPVLYELTDGRLLYTWEISPDDAATLGSPVGCAVSADQGKTWQHVSEDEVYDKRGTLLPNGDRIRFPEATSLPEDSLELPKCIGQNPTPGTKSYWLEDFDPNLVNRTWETIRIPAGSDKAVVEQAQIKNWPYQHVNTRHGHLIRPFPWGRVRIAPDGTLWMPHYTASGVNPKNGGFTPYDAVCILKSTDMGKSWELVHWVQYIPDTDNDPMAFSLEGLNECDIAFTAQGGMICLMRSHGRFSYHSHTYIIRSQDNGKTWTKPEIFDDHGVWPTMVNLKCGAILAGYGRPGLTLRVTADPKAEQWEEPIKIVDAVQHQGRAGKDVLMLMKTCGYCAILPLDDHTAGIAYSDFTHKDENGVARKTMLFRTITVEV